MDFVYDLLKLIHLTSAIVAVGSNLTYGPWVARARGDLVQTGFVLHGIKFLDRRIANPAYGVLFLSGAIMVFVGHWSLTSLWIVVAVVLFVGIAVLGMVLFAPVLKRQIELVEAGDVASAEFARLLGRSRMLGAVLGVLVLTILVMMVFKPSL